MLQRKEDVSLKKEVISGKGEKYAALGLTSMMESRISQLGGYYLLPDISDRRASISRPREAPASWTPLKPLLGRLTKGEKDAMDSDDEWIVIKVPKKMKGKFFFADFCDGDSEDEFQWLEGPYLQKSFTVADLLKMRADQPRSARRRKGFTEFRNNNVLDQQDNQGKILPPHRKCCKSPKREPKSPSSEWGTMGRTITLR